MFNPISAHVDAARKAPESMPIEVVNNVFKVMHGFYGNLFLSKFATGDLVTQAGPERGHDKGILSARQIWGHGLRGFDSATVKAALAQCMERHPEFPPSLPQFVALCNANHPRETTRSSGAIGMSQGLRSRYAAQARAINAKHAEASTRRAGGVTIPAGLEGLKLAIADAVGAAGGNEAAELVRLNRVFSGAHA